MTRVNLIYLNYPVTENGSDVSGHQHTYTLPKGFIKVEFYKEDKPGVRFVVKGVLFRNFNYSHSQYFQEEPVYLKHYSKY